MQHCCIKRIELNTIKTIEEQGNEHWTKTVETPLNIERLAVSDEDKINQIEALFAEIMMVMGLDLEDDSLKGTPYRVAKMYVKELFSGLKVENKPSISTFENKYNYQKLIIEKDITLYSACEHHFLPIIGKVHVGYISAGRVIGLSKINRIVKYYGKRPQVQERLTLQIANELKQQLNTESVIVIVDAKHLCVSMRGVEDTMSTTITEEYSGDFNDLAVRNRFTNLLKP